MKSNLSKKCSLLCLIVKYKTGNFFLKQICSTRLIAKLVVPTPECPAMTVNWPLCNPPIISSRNLKPVGISIAVSSFLALMFCITFSMSSFDIVTLGKSNLLLIARISNFAIKLLKIIRQYVGRRFFGYNTAKTSERDDHA